RAGSRSICFKAEGPIQPIVFGGAPKRRIAKLAAISPSLIHYTKPKDFDLRSKTQTGTDTHGYPSSICAGLQHDALGPAPYRHHLHDRDRQPAIWLDALR